jgi:hypothetical protein
MEAYKHSCPVCGQHVEYTAGYCGRQMQCPMCGGTIVFPAIPPARGGKPVAVEPIKPSRKWMWNAKAIVLYLRDYPHWHTLGQIAVPFLIVGALLAGAVYVKNKIADQPEPAPVPLTQAPRGGWDKMTEFARADQKVQQDVQLVTQAKKSLVDAQRVLELEQKRFSQAHGSDEQQAVQPYVQSAQLQVTQAQGMFNACRNHFQTDMAIYRKLGGTIDYNARVPNN